MGWLGDLWDFAEKGVSFVPGVGPYVSAGMDAAQGLFGGSGGYLTENERLEDPTSRGGGWDRSGSGGGGYDIWGLLNKAGKALNTPLGLAGVSGIANYGSNKAAQRYMAIQEAIAKEQLARMQTITPEARQKMSEIAVQILEGQGPRQQYLNGLSSQPNTFDFSRLLGNGGGV